MSNTSLSSVLFALQDRNLLVPDNLLADMTPMAGLIVESHKEGWILGHKYWRNLRIPVVCFETLSGGSLKKHSENACIAVFNRCSDNESVGFWGMLVQSAPQIMQLSEANLETISAQLSEAEIAAVHVNGEQASIPDLAFVEERLSLVSGL